MIHVCIPVLKRYDLLRDLLLSLKDSTVQPEMVHIIDNGRSEKRLGKAIRSLPSMKLALFTPTHPMGVATSWNWFIHNVPEDRLITNDDVLFAPHSLQRMTESPGSFISALPGPNACSCFIIRDGCISKVGLFDETISPNYAYFEDCDYVERMVKAKIRITPVECGVNHLGSQTLAASTPKEWLKHHKRFAIAQQHFVDKWGRMPDLNRNDLYD